MWVIYHKASRRIVGVTAHSEQDADRQSALTEVVSGLIGTRGEEEYDAIQVTDRMLAAKYVEAFPRRLVVENIDGAMRLSIRDPEFFILHVTTDAPDVHPVDGIAEIQADGVSSALIDVRKIDERGQPMQRPEDSDTIYLRTDHGVLRDRDGGQDISEIALAQGAAQFRLFSERAKRVATVRMFNADPKLRDGTVRIEFI